MYYQEITLTPFSGININRVWTSAFKQVHLALVTEMNKFGGEKGKIGVSFPQYRLEGKEKTLGKKLRVFAEDKADLESLNLWKWLYRLDDYVTIDDIKEVPSYVTSYAIYRRYHNKAVSAMSKARRYAKRHDCTEEEAMETLHVKKRAKVELPPYLRLYSESDNHKVFNLCIEKIPQEHKNYAGFNGYGLDNISTVPEF